VTTLVISDLHLGANAGVDLLRRGDVRRDLIAGLQGVERVVLLGDALELRHGPLRESLAAARGLFEELGAALGPAGRIVLLPGNHDHQLIAPWLDRRRLAVEPPPLALEQRIDPAQSDATAQLAAWSAPATLELAYPGIWLRPDVYATHGHYLDCHLTVPTFERLGVALMARLAGEPPHGGRTPDAYEAQLAPLYMWMSGLAQHATQRTAAGGSELSARVWGRLGGDGRGGAGAVLAAGALVPAAVALANRAGFGPFRADLSGAELRRAGLRALGAVLERLDVGAPWTLFGHTHRAGPLPDDDPDEWKTAAGTRLINAGSWVYQPHFVARTQQASPYWPGNVIVVPDEGPPELRRLLLERSLAELAPRRPG